MASSSRRSSIWGEGSAVVSGKGVAFADSAQGGECDLGQRLSIDHFEVQYGKGSMNPPELSPSRVHYPYYIFWLQLQQKQMVY